MINAIVLHIVILIIDMSTKTVRMDKDEEQQLERVIRLSGLTASAAIKEGLKALEERLQNQKTTRAFEVYNSLDLGPGGYASGPARQSRQAASAAIRRRAKK